ncbi:MAG: hypothetical protein ACYTXT_45210, partial [Nostoc sp.]
RLTKNCSNISGKLVQVQSWVKTNLAPVTLSDSEENEHTIVFFKGKAIEIICFRIGNCTITDSE